MSLSEPRITCPKVDCPMQGVPHQHNISENERINEQLRLSLDSARKERDELRDSVLAQKMKLSAMEITGIREIPSAQALLDRAERAEQQLEVARLERDELIEKLEDVDRGIRNQQYRGNSIGYIYDKMTCYRDQVGMAFDALRLLGWKAGDENGNAERQKAIMTWAESVKDSTDKAEQTIAAQVRQIDIAEMALMELSEFAWASITPSGEYRSQEALSDTLIHAGQIAKDALAKLSALKAEGKP